MCRARLLEDTVPNTGAAVERVGAQQSNHIQRYPTREILEMSTPKPPRIVHPCKHVAEAEKLRKIESAAFMKSLPASKWLK